MELYNGNLSQGQVSDVLRHFGGFEASLVRLNSMFAAQNRPISYDGKEFYLFDASGRSRGVVTSEEFGNIYVEYMLGAKIERYDVDLRCSLRLNDVWEDDPIGSGGLEIFGEFSTVKSFEKSALKKIFGPFDTIIYPKDVFRHVSVNQLDAMRRYIFRNKFARSELDKRRKRAVAIGEDFNKASKHEYVWVYLTERLRNWAIENDYDSFVYRNVSEGKREDSYVTLRPTQAGKPTEIFRFDREKYQDIVFPMLRTWHVHSVREGGVLAKQTPVDHLMWPVENPSEFFRPNP